MVTETTREDLPKNYVQKDKYDWWLCRCGKHHKGFPYKCPELKKKGLGNVLFENWWEFWFVVVIQIMSIIAIPCAIQNIYAYLKRKS